MNENICPQCGAPLDPSAAECRFCGEKIVRQAPQQPPYGAPQQPPYGAPQQPPYGAPQQPPYAQAQVVYMTGINPSWPVKSKIAAGVLAILLGGLGIHKFYLGKVGMGILYLLFCWTGVPAVLGLIEGIIYLCSNDENFQLKHHVRIQ